MVKAKAELLFELSWEVVNKVGGIYTVVMSKAALMKHYFKEYILVGPYFEDKAKFNFEQIAPPKEIKEAFEELKAQNIECYYGKWKIKGEPRTILIDFNNYVGHKDDIKKALWENYQIDSIKSGWDFDEPMIWSYLSGILIEKIVRKYQNPKVSVQCHEWMAGFALLHLKSTNLKIGTVFTTHATILGRSLAGNNYDLYNILDKINPEEEAYKFKIESKFHTERACALASDVFTTVSEITGIEAEKFLGRKPDVFVLNGLDISKFPTIEETSIKHYATREKIREFLTYYFFPHYTFDIDHNIIFFIVGRYEFRNKGLDILIKALGNLNEKLRKDKSPRTVTVFFWIPIHNSGLKTVILENKNYFRHIKNYVNYHSDKIINNVVSNIVSHKKLSVTNIFDDEFLSHLKKDISQFKRSGDPPLSTHFIDEDNDMIIRELRSNGLNNKETDKVKAIVYPVYLDGSDDMINLPYYDAISGCHLGIFPSYYEPWGYTPLEAAALGVTSITTDLAGFGRFIEHAQKGKKQEGIYIVKRMGQPEDAVLKNFSTLLYNFTKLHRPGRVENKQAAKDLSELADWKILIENYVKAHNMAIDKTR